MCHIPSRCSVVQRTVSYLLHEFTAVIAALIVAVSVNVIAVGKTSTLPNGVACGNVRQTSAVLWAHSTAVRSATFEYSHAADVDST